MKFTPLPLPQCAVVLTLLFTGCSFKRPLPEEELRQGLLARQAFSQKYGEIDDTRVARYLNALALRLQSGLPSNAPRSSYQITMLATSTPIAASLGGGQLVISRGLVRSLRNEAELAFVLSHEIAHDLRGDSSALAAGAITTDDIQESEMRADKIGLGIMAMAGYDPRPGLSAVARAYRAMGYQAIAAESIAHYPTPDARIQALQQQIQSSGWRPPGTIDRRDFQSLRQALAGKTATN